MVGLGRLRAGSMAMLALVGQAGWVSGALADQFHLRNGQVLDAEVLASTRNTVTLRAGGALRPIGLSEIERVVLPLADGGELSGELLGWRDGTFELRLADGIAHVADGRILEDATGGSPPILPEQRPEDDEQGAPSSTLMAGLPEVSLGDGRVLAIEVLDLSGAILTARSAAGSTLRLLLSEVETLRFVDEGGAVVSGRLLDWSGGVYRVALSGETDREVLAVLTADAAASGGVEATDAAVLPEGAVPPERDEQVGAGGPPPEASDPAKVDDPARAGDLAKVGDPARVGDLAKVGELAPGTYRVESKARGVSEDDETVVFEFRLDPPAERPLVILYAATEDTAKAGEDFEAKSGVITFAVGSAYAEVQVPLIDDGEGEKSEQFHLFLSGDPDTIHFDQRQVPATISDND